VTNPPARDLPTSDLLGSLRAMVEREDLRHYPAEDLTRLAQQRGLSGLSPELVATLINLRRLARQHPWARDALVAEHLDMITAGVRDDRSYELYLGLRAILQDRREPAVCEIVHRQTQLRLMAADLARLSGDSADATEPGRSLRWAAEAILRHVPLSETAGQADLMAVAVTLLPITAVPDEMIFIRSLQAFECIFRSVNVALMATIDAFDAGCPERCCDALEAAVLIVSATPALWRALTAIRVDQFREFRLSTMGTSALASVEARRIEMLVDELPAGRDAYPVEVAPVDRTLRECLDDQLWLQGSSEPVNRAVGLLTSLDRWFSAWKRTHVSIARRYIGDAPGTGGTTGVTYLERWAKAPLMPFLDGARRARVSGASQPAESPT
jgi:tryptophan 2,3-dioxygenase